MSKSIKFYKNPHREEVEAPKKVELQYEKLGITPLPVSGAISGHVMVFKKENQVEPKPMQHSVPYAEAVEVTPIKSGQLPNIGLRDNGWSSLNLDLSEEIIEDFDPSKIIDNNDYVDVPELSDAGNRIASTIQTLESESQKMDSYPDLLGTLYDLEESSYLLIVNGMPICSGPLDEIQQEATSFVFGDHELCKEEGPIPLENIMIFKKAKVKVGLFFE